MLRPSYDLGGLTVRQFRVLFLQPPTPVPSAAPQNSMKLTRCPNGENENRVLRDDELTTLDLKNSYLNLNNSVERFE
jgi:hypothetical protein